jgi:HK97 family phage portal protein
MGWQALIPRGLPVRSGVAITPETALGLTAAYSAINTIATDTACLPLRLYQTRRGGGRDLVTMHPLVEVLKWTPDGETTPMRQRQALMGHTLGWGNGYQEIERNNDGEVIKLHLLCPRATRPQRTQDSEKRLYYQLENGEKVAPDRVLHLAGLGFDGLCGYSPITLAREAVGLGLAAEAFGASFFGNGSQASGVLKFPGRLTDRAREQLRLDWAEHHQGVDNAHKPAILEEGMEWQQTTISPENAQFLATRQFQVVEIARIFRVPPHKIGDFTQAHLANIEASNLDYLQTTLSPWCEQQEQILNLRLLTRAERERGLYIEHVLAAILRGDMKARAEFYTKLRDLGAINPDEIRERENLNPLPHGIGQTYLVPLNLVALAHAGDPPVTSSVRSALEARLNGNGTH